MTATNRLGGLALVVKRGNAQTFSAPLPDGKQRSAATDYYLALAALRGGKATPEDFRALAVSVNVCRILASRGFGEEHAGLVRPAFDALARIQQRRAARGVFGIDGDGMRALTAVSELIEEQARVATVADVTAAHDEMNRLLAKGRIYKP